uniref:Uncharacterized protein n=1 Tax=Rhizophora mucronata TaxID=61149 RepID=A0A2P2R0T0_RHIMU
MDDVCICIFASCVIEVVEILCLCHLPRLL